MPSSSESILSTMADVMFSSGLSEPMRFGIPIRQVTCPKEHSIAASTCHAR
jgi:hypothetical protein